MKWAPIKPKKQFVRVRTRPVDAEGMNKTERAYANHLQELKMTGRIRDGDSSPFRSSFLGKYGTFLTS
ncbi:MAG: hypothetical protein QM757_26610 [Paludibaculum sp.]